MHASSQDELLKKLKNHTSDTIIETYFDDFDGDGQDDMFALTGAESSGNVWFVSVSDCEMMPYNYSNASPSDSARFEAMEMNGKKYFNYFLIYGNGQTVTTVCFFGNSDNLTVKQFNGYLSCGENGFYVTNSVYDYQILKNNFNAGNYSGSVRSWKDYWHYYDETADDFREYGGTEITKEQFCQFDGGEDILNLVTEGYIYNILYRANGIININILKESSLIKENDAYNCTNILVGYDDGSVWVIEDENNDYSPNIRSGFYLPALTEDIALYPEFEIPASFTLPSTLTVSLDDVPPILYARGASNVTFSADNDDIISLVETSEKSIFETAEVSGVYVKGLTPGTAVITATAPDGSSARCTVTVEGKIADTIDDELVLKAKICANNAEYQYMRDSYKSPDSVLIENSNLWASEQYQNINDFLDFFELDYSATDYYEVVLMDMINNKNNYYETVNDVIDNAFIKKVVDEANDALKENKNANKVTITGMYCFDVDKFYTDLTFLDAIFAAKDVSESMYEKYEQIYALTLVTDEQIKALEEIKNNTGNDNLKKACDKAIQAQAEAAQQTANEIALNAAFAGFEELGDFVTQRGWDVLISVIPGVKEAKAILSVGKLVSNGLYNADAISTDLLTMAATTEIAETARQIMKINEEEFLNDSTSETALNFMAMADFYKSISLYGCDSALEFAEDVEYANNAQSVFDTIAKVSPSITLKSMSALNALLKKCNAETITEFKESVSKIKTYIKGYNFYDPYGNDIALYIRDVVSATPSE